MDDEAALHGLKCLALGRLFRMGSRPFREGDIEEYHRLRSIIVDGAPSYHDTRPNYARDRLKGAAGDFR